MLSGALFGSKCRSGRVNSQAIKRRGQHHRFGWSTGFGRDGPTIVGRRTAESQLDASNPLQLVKLDEDAADFDGRHRGRVLEKTEEVGSDAAEGGEAEERVTAASPRSAAGTRANDSSHRGGNSSNSWTSWSGDSQSRPPSVCKKHRQQKKRSRKRLLMSRTTRQDGPIIDSSGVRCL